MESDFVRFIESKGVKMVAVMDPSLKCPDDTGWDHDSWKCRLTYEGHKLTVPFFMGIGNEGKAPTAADVLSAIISDTRAGEMAFSEFCSEFGEDEDSRKAERTWKACRSLGKKVRRFLGSDFDTFGNLAW